MRPESGESGSGKAKSGKERRTWRRLRMKNARDRWTTRCRDARGDRSDVPRAEQVLISWGGVLTACTGKVEDSREIAPEVSIYLQFYFYGPMEDARKFFKYIKYNQ